MLKHIFHLRIGVLFAIEMAALCSLNIEKPDFFFFSEVVWRLHMNLMHIQQELKDCTQHFDENC